MGRVTGRGAIAGAVKWRASVPRAALTAASARTARSTIALSIGSPPLSPTGLFIRHSVTSQCLCGFRELSIRHSDGYVTQHQTPQSLIIARVVTLVTPDSGRRRPRHLARCSPCESPYRSAQSPPSLRTASGGARVCARRIVHRTPRGRLQYPSAA